MEPDVKMARDILAGGATEPEVAPVQGSPELDAVAKAIGRTPVAGTAAPGAAAQEQLEAGAPVAHGGAAAANDPLAAASMANGAGVSPAPAARPVPPPPTAIQSTAADRLQLIDEHQQMHADAFQRKMSEWGLADAGFGYDICAVLGSQSTGKSTLLNRIFGTQFDVMDERVRRQTTKGIWLSRGTERNVLVMDVEGTDGRERGEDQDFERKAALFSLTTAECLIVNMWENQVGLYQGANMGLLKTVLDVNLSLFQAGRARTSSREKTLLMFVIRDFVGTTPLENLQATVVADLEQIWASLSKPEHLKDARLTDFFDLMFTALPHKVLLPGEFDQACAQLKRRFVNQEDPNYVFRTEYHKRIPMDGLPHYLSSVWEQVLQNKDLDLPTQQELLAQFRCDELAEAAFVALTASLLATRQALEGGGVVGTLGAEMASLRDTALSSFDKDASRYHAGVYSRKRQDLLARVHTAFTPVFHAQLRNLHKQLAAQFRTALLDATRSQSAYDFHAVFVEQYDAALHAFDRAISDVPFTPTDFSVDEERAALVSELHETAAALRADECRKVIVRVKRDVRKALAEPIELALARPTEQLWDTVLRTFLDTMRTARETYLRHAKSLNCTPDEDASALSALQRRGWLAAMGKIQEQTSDAALAMRLRSYFEARFRYDADGIPRVWRPTDDMDGAFVRARDATLQLVPLYARIAPQDETLFTQVASALDDEEYAAAVERGDEEPLDLDESRQVLSELRCTEVGDRFRRDADALFVEAKRGTVSGMAQVPAWVYVALVVLGWNEAMAVLRSPVYFTLLCLVLTGAYFVWRLNLSGPLLIAAQTLTRELRQYAEEQIRAYLGPPGVPPVRTEPVPVRENVELPELRAKQPEADRA